MTQKPEAMAWTMINKPRWKQNKSSKNFSDMLKNRERKVTQSLSTFRKAFWDIQETLSWMAYRKPEEMNTPYRYGFLYPNTQGTPKLIIKEPV